jgi:hypothetical protein
MSYDRSSDGEVRSEEKRKDANGEPTSTAREPSSESGAVYEQANRSAAVPEADAKRSASGGNGGRFSGEQAREAGRKGGLTRGRRLKQAKNEGGSQTEEPLEALSTCPGSICGGCEDPRGPGYDPTSEEADAFAEALYPLTYAEVQLHAKLLFGANPWADSAVRPPFDAERFRAYVAGMICDLVENDDCVVENESGMSVGNWRKRLKKILEE